MNGKSLHRTYRNKSKQKEKMKKMEQKYERNKRMTRRWKAQKSFTNRRKKIYIYIKEERRDLAMWMQKKLIIERAASSRELSEKS